METTGARDAADLKAELDAECRLLYHNPHAYEELLAWNQDIHLQDPLLKRQLNVLIRSFKPNQIPKDLLEDIAHKEAQLAQTYATFRPEIANKHLSDNEILDILKKENNPTLRQKAWEASKSIGEIWAPQILNLVALRNQAAQSLGYVDYFRMQLDLQEIDEHWLFHTLDTLAQHSDAAYLETLQTIELHQAQRFNTKPDLLGPWAWSDPFCQQDPIDTLELDTLVTNVDIISTVKDFYHQMGLDVGPILMRSDMFERQDKNQHAFCINIDRNWDVRTLNNVRPTIKWLETVLHELGHAIYEIGLDQKLPWLLREPPHMLTTEAMALLAGRQAYRPSPLGKLIGYSKSNEELFIKAEHSLTRRQLIFSRWVLVMTHFESALYSRPDQDLNHLWWELVKKHQKIRPPASRQGKSDWATKYHLGLAPVYYFSYLLGEMLASSIEERLIKDIGNLELTSKSTGQWLQHHLFHPGNSSPWHVLVQQMTGQPLNAQAWLGQFASKK